MCPISVMPGGHGKVFDLVTGRTLPDVPLDFSDVANAYFHFSFDGRAVVQGVLRSGGRTLLYQPLDGSAPHTMIDPVQEVIRDFGGRELRVAEQIHGNGVAMVTVDSSPKSPKADALVTDDPAVLLGIYVADCCAVYLVDTRNRAIGLAHSGRKGTELNVAGATLRSMVDRFGTEPKNVVAQLSPCIRPPHYEIDFAAEIARQARAAGVAQFHDGGVCTASSLARYYSYRAEKGKTGRMWGVFMLEE